MERQSCLPRILQLVGLGRHIWGKGWEPVVTPPSPSFSAARVGPGPQQLLQLCQPAAKARRHHHPLHGTGQAGHRIREAAGDDRLSLLAGTGPGQR